MIRAGSVLLVFLYAANISAQVPPSQTNNGSADITNIIRDILGETRQPFPAPPGAPPLQSMGIENIPVSINLANDTQFDGEWLVVSAHAPPPASKPRTQGEMLGQTRLLLRGLTPPFNIVIAAPIAVTKNLEFALISGEIENRNGETIFVSSQEGQYRGVQAASLTLEPKALIIGTQPPDVIAGFEQTQGQVSISNPDDMFRGSILTVQLTETGLVGGNQNSIKGETRIEIDGQRPPFTFTLDYGVPQSGFNMPLTLSGFITDWAGRKTHVMAKPLDFNGPNYDYRLQLDSFRQGQDVANFQFSDPSAASETEIKGQAVFNAYKGLERDSYLKIRLLSPLGVDGQPREISAKRLNLNGLSGNIDFAASAPSIHFDPELPTPLIKASIVNASGNVIFESAAQPVTSTAVNFVNLSPRPIY